VQEVLHFNLHIQDKIPAVKEFPQARFRVELLRNANVYLFRNFLQLKHSCVFQSIGYGTITQRVGTVCVRRGDRL